MVLDKMLCKDTSKYLNLMQVIAKWHVSLQPVSPHVLRLLLLRLSVQRRKLYSLENAVNTKYDLCFDGDLVPPTLM